MARPNKFKYTKYGKTNWYYLTKVWCIKGKKTLIKSLLSICMSTEIGLKKSLKKRKPRASAWAN